MKNIIEVFEEILKYPVCRSECTGRCSSCEGFDFHYVKFKRQIANDLLKEIKKLNEIKKLINE